MKNIGQIMKQAQQMQTKMAETMSGKGELRGVKIDPSLANPDDIEVLEDLIMAAANDAKAKVEVRVQEEMQKLTGGLQLPPGMQLPF